MQRKTVAVLFGGNSSEYEVSLESACAVIENLNQDKYDLILLGITRQGAWLKYEGDTVRIKNDTWQEHPSCVPAIISPDRNTRGMLVCEGDRVKIMPVDVAFPVLHGKNGEDGTIQGLLAMAGIPCVGCGMLSSAVCMDKDIAHKLVHSAGIKTPNSIIVYTPIPDFQLLYEQMMHLQYPLFVKPANSGSSLGITEVNKHSNLLEAVRIACQYDHKVIIEEAIPGFEVGCAVVGDETLTIGAIDEIELSQGFFNYEEKYSLTNSKIHMPARIDVDTADHIKKTAATIYRILGCAGFARVDLFLTPDLEIIFNEVNTIPGFTTHSRYPNMLKGIGMTFQQIVDKIIRLAMEQ